MKRVGLGIVSMDIDSLNFCSCRCKFATARVPYEEISEEIEYNVFFDTCIIRHFLVFLFKHHHSGYCDL